MQGTLFTDFLRISDGMTVFMLFVLFLSFVGIYLMEKRKISFSILTTAGLILGISIGFLVQYFQGFPGLEEIQSKVWIQETVAWYGLFGTLFVDFIRMMLFPIIIISMIRVILDLKQGVNMSHLIRTSLFLLLTITAVSAIVGIIVSLLTHIGSNMVMVHEVSQSPHSVITLVDVLLNLVPANPIRSMLDNNIIAMVIFATLFGSAAREVRNDERYTNLIDHFTQGIHALSHIIMKVAMNIIRFMPYAVVALMAKVLIAHGMNIIGDAFSFIWIVYLALFLMLLVHMGIIFIYGLNPFIYLRKSMPVLLMALSSRSSIGTLPVTISVLQNSMGVSSSTANFVASLGSTAGMNACAGLFPVIVVFMITTMTGMSVDFSLLVMMLIISVLSSLGLAGIPGAAMMAVSIMLSGLGMIEYFELLGIVLAVDPILDMGRTVINVSGAMTTAVCTDKELGLINKSVYDSLNVVNVADGIHKL